MPLSIADRLHQMPFGAQAAVAEKLKLNRSTVSLIARGEYPAKTEETRQQRRAVQEALAAHFEPPLPVWDVFEEWDGEKPSAPTGRGTKEEAPRSRAKAS